MLKISFWHGQYVRLFDYILNREAEESKQEETTKYIFERKHDTI